MVRRSGVDVGVVYTMVYGAGAHKWYDRVTATTGPSLKYSPQSTEKECQVDRLTVRGVAALTNLQP